MYWLWCIRRQFASFGILNLHIFYPLQEFLDRTLDIVSFAEFHISSVVLDLNVLLEDDVLVKLIENAAAVKDVLDAV